MARVEIIINVGHEYFHKMEGQEIPEDELYPSDLNKITELEDILKRLTRLPWRIKLIM